MQCPRSDGELKEVEIDGVIVDICDACGGIWFDARELEKFDESHEEAGQNLLDLMEQYQSGPVDHDRPLKNPKFPEIELVRRYYSPKEQIEIDECPTTGSIWLDGGELAKIREMFPTQEARRNAYRNFAVRWKTSTEIEKMKKESTKSAQRVTNLMDWLFGK